MGCCCSVKQSVTNSISTDNSTIKVKTNRYGRRPSMEKTTTATEDIRKVYRFEPKVVGHGRFGSVRVAYSKSNPSLRYAIKTIDKEKIKSEIASVRREVEILKTLSHPNIVKFYETYQDERYFHIVMEYCNGGELLDHIISQGQLNELEAAKLMSKIFLAIAYLHENGVCHRDLKLENFLFADKSDNPEIKLIDFGLSNRVWEGEEQAKFLNSKVGTPLYVAPEVIDGKYNENCDNWGLGVVLYMLLSGRPPFYADSSPKIFKLIQNGSFSFSSNVWKTVSPEGKDLISKLLVVDPNRRLTASEALNHPWFKKFEEFKSSSVKTNMPIVDNSVLESLKKYTFATKFKREALKIIVRMLTDTEISKLNEAFRNIDHQNTGIIKVSDLYEVMANLGLSEMEEEVRKVIKEMANVGQDEINYMEFMAATLNSKKTLTHSKLWTAFKHFAIDDAHFINKANLRQAMARFGRKLPEDELTAMIQEVDKDNLGKINFEQFCHLMMSGNLEEIANKDLDAISDISSPKRRASALPFDDNLLIFLKKMDDEPPEKDDKSQKSDKSKSGGKPEDNLSSRAEEGNPTTVSKIN